MASSRSTNSSKSKRQQSQSTKSKRQQSQSTKATSVPSDEPKRSSAYDKDFEQHLADHAIYPPFHKFPDGRSASKPADLEEIRQLLQTHRPSLSLSVFPESAFEDFQQKNEAVSEGSVMRSVIPIITGNNNADIANEGHVPFFNMDSMTENTTVRLVPDFFGGSRPGALDKKVRDDSGGIVKPSKQAKVPEAPNFFLEVKAPRGGADVARRQACHDGAHGARAMYSLQNYGRKEDEQPVYDSKTYAYSSTYHAGTLHLYYHHVTAPTTPGEQPEYYMTQLKAYVLTSDRETYVEGARGLRNLRDLARQHRDNFIQAANTRARQSDEEEEETLSSAQDNNNPVGLAELEQDEGSSPGDFVDCEQYPTQQDVLPASQQHHQGALIDPDDWAAASQDMVPLTLNCWNVA